MRLPDGVHAVLSATLMAGLAVGLGLGGHRLFEGDGEGGAASRPSDQQRVLSDDLCTLMDDLAVEIEQMEDAMLDSALLLATQGGDEDSILEGLHDFGRTLLGVTSTMAVYLNHGAGLVSDPEVAEAFEDLAHAMAAMGDAVGGVAVEAQSLDAYMRAAESVSADPELEEIMKAGEVATPIVERYVIETCERDIFNEA